MVRLAARIGSGRPVAEAAIGSNAIGPLTTVESATAAEATTAPIAAASKDFLFMLSPGMKKLMGGAGAIEGERAPRRAPYSPRVTR
jgi:hypothetical protein